MNSKYNKRLFAYLFDFLLLFFVVMLISVLLPKGNISTLKNELEIIEQSYLFNTIDQQTYLNETSLIMSKMFKENVLSIMINIVFIILYFIVLPFINKGQTIGMKVLNIKIVNNKLESPSLNELVLRNIVTNGLGYLIIVLSIYYIIPKNIFFITISLLAIIQLLLVIISSFMIIYKKNRKGIQDLISNTKVIDC